MEMIDFLVISAVDQQTIAAKLEFIYELIYRFK